MQPSPDDWDPTSLLNGPVRDPVPRPRSYWPHLLRGFVALAVAALLIVAAFRYVWPHSSDPSRADGETALQSIALPEGWLRSDIAYSNMFYDPEMTWSQEIMADSGDLDDVAATVERAIFGAGFTKAECVQESGPKASCSWYAKHFSLRSSVQDFAPLLKAPCRSDLSECARIYLTLTHRKS